MEWSLCFHFVKPSGPPHKNMLWHERYRLKDARALSDTTLFDDQVWQVLDRATRRCAKAPTEQTIHWVQLSAAKCTRQSFSRTMTWQHLFSEHGFVVSYNFNRCLGNCPKSLSQKSMKRWILRLLKFSSRDNISCDDKFALVHKKNACQNLLLAASSNGPTKKFASTGNHYVEPRAGVRMQS